MAMIQKAAKPLLRGSCARAVPGAANLIHQRGFKSLKESPRYSAKATSQGSRANGVSKLDEGSLELKMRLPKALGGPGGEHNPEELFAMGYSTCFLSALGAVYKEKFGTVTGKPFSESAVCKAEIVIGNAADTNGFRLAAHLRIPYDSLKESGLTKDQARELIKEAHKICPYSRATQGNIEHVIDLV